MGVSVHIREIVKIDHPRKLNPVKISRYTVIIFSLINCYLPVYFFGHVGLLCDGARVWLGCERHSHYRRQERRQGNMTLII